MVAPRVVIVGAGPAGVRCAEMLVASGLRPTVLDENTRAGGQIYRQQPANFSRPADVLYGPDARRATAIHATMERLADRIDYRPDTTVWNVAGQAIFTESAQRTSQLPYDALVFCTGATDRLLAVKGWQSAGAFSLGGAQVALKSQGCAIGRRVVFMGTGPLLYLVAAQYCKAGADVAAVLDTSPWASRVGALPGLLANPALLARGVSMQWLLARAGVAWESGIEPLEIVGSPASGVQGVRYRNRRGQDRSLDCDAVAIGYHLRSEHQLAELAGCELQFDESSRQWRLQLDSDGRCSVPNVYAAGDGARILGAYAAEDAGQLAALALLTDHGVTADVSQLTALRQRMQRHQKFAAGLQRSFPWPAHLAGTLADSVAVCRCEMVSAGEIRKNCELTDDGEINRIKAFSRVGMGRCQGRYCAPTAAELIAQTTKQPLQAVGRLRGQAPVKPLPIGITVEPP